MGQYFYVVNLDKRQFLHPHTLGDGLKLFEVACGNGTLRALHLLLADNAGDCLREGGRCGGATEVGKRLVGSWAGDRIVVAGDYAPPGRFPGVDDDENVHNVASEAFEDISLAMRELCLACGLPLGKRWDE